MTKRHHINPCFWTALWNKEYYNAFINNKHKNHRTQKVYSLEVAANKVLLRKTEDVHFREGLGWALVDSEDILSLAGSNWNANTPEPGKHFILDFENHFSMLEEIGGYSQLLDTIRAGKIPDEITRVHLASFLAIHQLRSHSFIDAITQLHTDQYGDKARLMAFVDIKKIITTEQYLMNLISPLVHGKWTCYIISKPCFPLSDLPVISEGKKTFAILSPNIYLEVDEAKKYPGEVIYKRSISSFKYYYIKKRIIENTRLSIIFSDSKLLESWKRTRLWKKRLKIGS